MSKLNCEIVKDLLPLYADKVCSKASEEAVKEHIAECDECKKTLESFNGVPRLTEFEDNAEKAVVKVGKKMKKHTKKAVIKTVSIILSVLIVLGVVAFFTVPLQLAKKSYSASYLAMQCNHIKLDISNNKKPNFNGKYGSVYLDKSLGEYKVENLVYSQQLVFDENKKITFLRYEGEVVESLPFSKYCASEYVPFITTNIPFLVPVIEKGVKNLGFSFEDIDNCNFAVQKFLAQTHCDEIDGYAEECAYYFLNELIMPLTNGGYIVAENDVCEGYGYTMYGEYGATHVIEMQLKDNTDIKCTVSFTGFSLAEVEKIFDSFVIVH